MRAVLFAGCLAIAATLITIGVHQLDPAAGYVTAGIGVGVWSWLVLSE